MNDALNDTFLADLAERLKAIAHPVRLKVLATLAGAQGCQCGQIVAGLPLAQSTVSQHIKVLLGAGLVCGEIEKARCCYCLDADAMDALRRDLDLLFSALRAPAMGRARTEAKTETQD